jgi:hypothetical protein
MLTRQEAVDKIITLGEELVPIVKDREGEWEHEVRLRLSRMNQTFDALERTGVPYMTIVSARGKMNGVSNALESRGRQNELSSKVNALNTVIASDISGLAQSGGRRRRKTRKGGKSKRLTRARTGRKSSRL